MNYDKLHEKMEKVELEEREKEVGKMIYYYAKYEELFRGGIRTYKGKVSEDKLRKAISGEDISLPDVLYEPLSSREPDKIQKKVQRAILSGRYPVLYDNEMDWFVGFGRTPEEAKKVVIDQIAKNIGKD